MTEREESLFAGVCVRLLRYVRGYAVLMAVDTAVYTGLFFVIGVPYCLLFGILSGLSVLVPGLGGVAAALITLTVSGLLGVVWWRLLLVLAVYLVYGCVIEQFVVYPALVGGVLGLTKGESLLAMVIGLLIGNLFGMLLMLPVAGILKYIWLRMRKEGPRC